MAGHARGISRWVAGWLDSPGDSEQRGPLELRSVHVPEYPQGHGALAEKSATLLGDGAAGSVRRLGAGTRGAGAGDEAQVAFCHSCAVGLVAHFGGDCHANVRGLATEDLEQYTQRNEPGAAPATAAPGAHGRAFAADQSAFSLQHAEH